MSEIKRVGLTTLEPQKALEKGSKKFSRTLRIAVVLTPSTEKVYPDLNYKDELAAAKKKLKQNIKDKEAASNPASNGLDPFDEDNDDDVRRIAREMEAKYGSGVTNGTKKRRKGRKDDYADIGMGYDESDSFIDNTDGYDEIIPHNVTTARGGFYINSGALEFKTDEEASSAGSSSSSESEDSSDSESEEEKDKDTSQVKRKRVLETSTEESNEASGKDEKKPKLDIASEKPSKISMAQAIKKKLFSTNKIKVKKQRLSDLALKKTDKENKSDSRRGSLSRSQSENDSEKECKKEKLSMRLSSVNAAIDSVISKATVDSPVASTDTLNSAASANRDSPSPPKLELQVFPSFDLNAGSPKTEVPQLPENLPSEILETIESLKKEADLNKELGKQKFFSGNVNSLLLSLERKCKILGRSSRLKVYEHLAPFAKCRKETLMKRAKNLVCQDELKKMSRSVVKLKTTIAALMPNLIANHEVECQKVMQRKMEASNSEEQAKQIRAPKRRFPFSEETKKTIRDILTSKKRCLILEGKSKNTMEDLLLEYVKNEILCLWPEGWMSVNALKKFCMSAAAKTPDPKSVKHQSKHSEKTATSLPASTLTLSQANNLTITPVNLSEKLNEVRTSQKLPYTIKPMKEPSKPSPPKDSKPTQKDNGIVTINPMSKPTFIEKSSNVKSTSQTGTNGPTKHPLLNQNSGVTVTKHPSLISSLSGTHSSTVSGLSSGITVTKHSSHTSNSHNTTKQSHQPGVQISNLLTTHSITKHSNQSSGQNSGVTITKHSNQASTQLSAVTVTKHSSQSSTKQLSNAGVPKTHANSVTLAHLKSFDAFDKTGSISKSSANQINKPSTKPAAVPSQSITISSKEPNVVAPSKAKSTTQSQNNTNRCQIIDLTDQFSPPPAPSKVGERRRSTAELERDLLGSPTHGDDVMKVMESLKALQQMSSPVKSESSNTAPVSVIAYNKSSHGSNSNPSLSNVGIPATTTATGGRNDFFGTAINFGFQDEFQRRFAKSLGGLKPSSKPNYNTCS